MFRCRVRFTMFSWRVRVTIIKCRLMRFTPFVMRFTMSGYETTLVVHSGC